HRVQPAVRGRARGARPARRGAGVGAPHRAGAGADRARGGRAHRGRGAALARPARGPAARDGAPPDGPGPVAGPAGRVPRRHRLARPGRPGPGAARPMVTTLALPRPDAAPAEVVERTVEVLRAGGVVVLPTDTVYGLAALPSDAAATARLFDLKGRGRDVPTAPLGAPPGHALPLPAPAPAPPAA